MQQWQVGGHQASVGSPVVYPGQSRQDAQQLAQPRGLGGRDPAQEDTQQSQPRPALLPRAAHTWVSSISCNTRCLVFRASNLAVISLNCKIYFHSILPRVVLVLMFQLGKKVLQNI